jgi:WD40 repeat protein
MPLPTGESPRTEQMTPPASPGAASPEDVTLVGGRVSFTTSTPMPAGDRYPHIPGYAIQCELGRGGMGVVYRAAQDGLNRTVAVKTLLHHNAGDVSDVVRFRSEAEAVAAISHPHVVKVYESGQHEGRSYFAMEYLPGGTLHAKLRGRAPFAPDEAAALVEKLARAVHAGHSIGIVHRDLKPGNVLFDSAGEPRVTDFGLAKRVSCELTKTQAVMGTPAYMPPEQAAGRAKYVGPPADIYALGVILYECLTGRTPFTGEDSLLLLNQVIADDPPSIRAKAPAVPRDLELICFKCLEKGPADRYQTAAELADDLRRFTGREPVSVRPAGVVEKVVKWAKRRPTLATAYGLGVLAAALTLFGGGAAVLAVQAAAARDDANRHWETTEQARELLQQQADELEKARATADEHWKAAEKARDELAGKHEEVGAALTGERKAKEALAKEHTALVATREELELERYYANVSLAQKEAAAGNYIRAADLLNACPPGRRKWEWWHAYNAVHQDTGSGVARLLPRDVAFTGTKLNVMTAHDHSLVVRFDFDTGFGTDVNMGEGNYSIRFSADGRRAVGVRNWEQAHADGVVVWDVKTGKRLAAFPSPKAACNLFELSADGHRVMFQYLNQPIRCFEVDTGKPLGELKAEPPCWTRAGLTADGRAIAVADGRGVVWSTDTGKEEVRLGCESGQVAAVGMAADGKTAAVGSTTGEVQFHPTGGKPVVVRRAHIGGVTALAFSADGAKAASAGEGGAVRVWDPATGTGLFEFHGHTKPVHALAFHPSGSHLVSCDTGGGFCLWPLAGSLAPVYPLAVGRDMKKAFATDRDLTRVFAGGDGPRGVEWKRATKVEYGIQAPQDDTFTAAAISPVGPQKVLGTDRGGVFVQADTGADAVALESHGGRVGVLKYSADGKRIVGTSPHDLRVWDADTGKVLTAVAIRDVGTAVALSPDGKWVAARYGKDGVYLAEVGAKDGCYLSAYADVSALEFTPNGKNLVVGSRGWGLTVFPLTPRPKGYATLTEGKKYVGHTSPVTSIGFSPDGTRLASGAADGSVRVWDVASGHEAIGLTTGKKEPVLSVWFTSDGKLLLAQPESGPPVVFDGSPRDLAYRSDRPLPQQAIKAPPK